MRWLSTFNFLFFISHLLCLVTYSHLTYADPTEVDQCSTISEKLVAETQKTQELYHQVVFSSETIKKQIAEIDKLNEKAKEADESVKAMSSQLNSMSEKYTEVLDNQKLINTKLNDISDILMIPMIYNLEENMDKYQDIKLLEKIHKEVSQLKLDYLYQIEASESNIHKIEALEKKSAMSSVTQDLSEINFVKDFMASYHIMMAIYNKFYEFTISQSIKYFFSYNAIYEKYADKAREALYYYKYSAKAAQLTLQATNIIKKVYFDHFHPNILSFSAFVKTEMIMKKITTKHILDLLNSDFNNFLDRLSQKYNMDIDYPNDLYNKILLFMSMFLMTYFGFKLALFTFIVFMKVIGMVFYTMFFSVKEPKQKISNIPDKPITSADQPTTHFKPSSNPPDFTKLSPNSNESKHNTYIKKNSNKKGHQHLGNGLKPSNDEHRLSSFVSM